MTEEHVCNTNTVTYGLNSQGFGTKKMCCDICGAVQVEMVND